MTLINIIVAMLLLGIFLFGFSQIFLPVYKAWHTARSEYNTVKTIVFVSESFKSECSKQDRNIENWGKAVSSAKELESYEISELKENGILRALKAICIISGERIEIIGTCRS